MLVYLFSVALKTFITFKALNQLCQNLCEAVSDQHRREAEETLTKLIESDDCLQSSLLLLESGIVRCS